MANRAYYCLIIILLSTPFVGYSQSDTVACAEPLEAGNCDSASATYNTLHFPMASDYYYSYSEVLLDSSDLAELAGYDIEYFAFLPTTLTDGSLYNNGCTIYMANTRRNLNNGLLQNSDNNFQLVYTGTLNFTEAGTWRVVRLDSTFRWDGHSSVVVAVNKSHPLGNSFSATASQFAAWRFTGNYVKARHIENRLNPYVLGMINEVTISTPYIPYYKLLTCSEYDPHTGEVEVCDTVEALHVDAVSADRAEVTWQGDGVSYDLRYRHVGQDDSPEHYVFGLTEPHYTINAYLLAGQEHYVQVRQTCSNEITSDWATVHFMVPEKEGIAEVEKLTKLYPNPAHDVLTLHADNDVTLRIVDLQGRTVLLQTLPAGEQSVDIITLARGSYLAVVSGAEGQTVRKLIIR